MNKAIHVLVTGVGGDLGQAIVKALRLSKKPIVCLGCDMDDSGIGVAFVDTFAVVPRADDPAYVDVLDHLCSSRRIHAVVPGSEMEIRMLASLGNPPKLPCGVPIICQEASWFDTYGDKLRCMEALGGKVELVPFADGTDRQAVSKIVREAGFPLVVKSRRSSGSRSLRRVDDRNELSNVLQETTDPLVQAFINSSAGEFSICVFACDIFSAIIAFRRSLGPVGCSWHAETSADEDVLGYARLIAEASGLKGSANIQVGKSGSDVRLFEINPRFSSLVAARAACGFRDVEWSLDLALGLVPEIPAKEFKHIRFRRFFHEVVDFGKGFEAASEWNPRASSIASTDRT